MNKTAIKNFAVWARNKLIADISYRAGLIGITESGIASALPQSTGTTEFYDIGTAEPYVISGDEVRQRRRLVELIERKEKETDYKTAYKYIIEEVAYTWFNRLVAIRFMEVNDYLPSHIRVLSSESGKMEPDIVTTPFDADLDFTSAEEQQIIQMKQDNKLDELFQILLIKQCNSLNEILPILFERTNDYTELLLNISFIDQEGVVFHLLNDIPEEDFNIERGGQVEIIGWLYQYYNTEPKSEAFSKKGKVTKDEIPAMTQLFTPDWIVRYMVENSLGRIWVERERSCNSEWKYFSKSTEQEIEVNRKLDEIKKDYQNIKLEEIKCIDPCMGSGHVLVYMFDVLMYMYESQGYSQRDAAQSILQNNLYGLDIDKRAMQISYFAIMMKAREYDRRILLKNITPNVYAIQESNRIAKNQISYFGKNFSELERNRASKQIEQLLNIFFNAKEYGSILRVSKFDWDLLERFTQAVIEIEQFSFESYNLDETQASLLDLIKIGKILEQKYHVVVTNPPYLAVSAAESKLNKYVKDNYPDSKTDMFAVFMERCSEMLVKNGLLAMVTMHSWMFLSSYEKLREKMKNFDLISMAHLGARGFDEIAGEVVQTTSFVLRKSNINAFKGIYHRLLDGMNENAKRDMYLSGINVYYSEKSDFECIPGGPIAYWMSDNLKRVYLEGVPLGSIAAPRKGNSTSDNNRFLRVWFEVEKNKMNLHSKEITVEDSVKRRWYPYNKGGGFRKWYGFNDYLVDWYDDAAAIRNIKSAVIANYQYFMKPGLTWSTVSSNNFSIRWFDEGYIFDNGGCCIFELGNKRPYLIALLNSAVFKHIFGQLNPTLNFQSGEVAKFPVLFCDDNEIDKLSIENVSIAKEEWNSYETSWDFKKHPLVGKYSLIEEAFSEWKHITEDRFARMKRNEEELNRKFIEIYGLKGELEPERKDDEITLRRADIYADIRSLISYAVGCMFGRYSLDYEGLIYAGGEWDENMYSSYIPDQDNIIPICDEEYMSDDIVSRFVEWLKVAYGERTLEDNLDYIASVLGNKGNTSREIIRNYFLNDFYKDHCSTYSVTGSGKRPIYWMFDSGKQNGFKALIYMHRYNEDTIGNLRVDYLHRVQRIYESEINRMQDAIEHSTNVREVSISTKRQEKLKKQLKECRNYDEQVGHLALSRVSIDLDDGFKINYEKIQNANDNKKYPVLAKI